MEAAWKLPPPQWLAVHVMPYTCRHASCKAHICWHQQARQGSACNPLRGPKASMQQCAGMAVSGWTVGFELRFEGLGHRGWTADWVCFVQEL